MVYSRRRPCPLPALHPPQLKQLPRHSSNGNCCHPNASCRLAPALTAAQPQQWAQLWQCTQGTEVTLLFPTFPMERDRGGWVNGKPSVNQVCPGSQKSQLCPVVHQAQHHQLAEDVTVPSALHCCSLSSSLCFGCHHLRTSNTFKGSSETGGTELSLMTSDRT